MERHVLLVPLICFVIFITCNVSLANQSEILEQYPYGINSTIYVYIDTENVPEGWKDDYYAAVLDALIYWIKGGNGDLLYTPKIRYTNESALKSAYDYDIIIRWVDRFENETSVEEIVGVTIHGVRDDAYGYLGRNGNFVGVTIHGVGDDKKWDTVIYLACHILKASYYEGITYTFFGVVSTGMMYDIARHELGHAFGLGHSNIKSDIMYYKYYKYSGKKILSEEEYSRNNAIFMTWIVKIIASIGFLIGFLCFISCVFSDISKSRKISSYLKITNKRELFKKILSDNDFNKHEVLITESEETRLNGSIKRKEIINPLEYILDKVSEDFCNISHVRAVLTTAKIKEIQRVIIGTEYGEVEDRTGAIMSTRTPIFGDNKLVTSPLPGLNNIIKNWELLCGDAKRYIRNRCYSSMFFILLLLIAMLFYYRYIWLWGGFVTGG